jgi:Leu/Phe-tRNA-protein transferase
MLNYVSFKNSRLRWFCWVLMAAAVRNRQLTWVLVSVNAVTVPPTLNFPQTLARFAKQTIFAFG